MHSDGLDTQRALAARFIALSRVGTALMREVDENRLLQLIAETACELTGAQFAAFSIRPIDETGQPLVPSEGYLFHLAAVVGVTKEQKEFFQHVPLGGEGLLAPIFHHGVSVLVSDVLTHITHASNLSSTATRQSAREAAFAYVHGELPSEQLRSMGVPRGHPLVRSFLGAPLLDRDKQVRGGLLLGHGEPGQFTPEDEVLLTSLAAQAAVALENARLYRMTQLRAQELHAIFESITDGIVLVNQHGEIVRENEAARLLRTSLQQEPSLAALLHTPAQMALTTQSIQEQSVVVANETGDVKEYVVTASPLHLAEKASGPLQQEGIHQQPLLQLSAGAVVVWHDVTERRMRERERVAYAEAEARLVLLQKILDELPSSVYLVYGEDARLMLANRATQAVWGAVWQRDVPMQTFLQSQGIKIFGTDGRPLAPMHLATIRVLKQKTPVYQHEESIRQPNGTTLSVVVNAVPLDLPRPFPFAEMTKQVTSEPCAIVVHQNVTALKETEQLKDEFLALAAHELRTPLAILKGFAQTLLVQTARGKGPTLAEWQTESLQGIDQATTRMVELTEDLLDVTRLQAGRLELQKEPTDLIALVQRFVGKLQLTTQHHLLLHSELPHLVVAIDPRRIEQVLSNLLGNAIKYSLGDEPVEITLSQDDANEMAVVRIRDYGIGIPTPQHSRLFGRFARADNAQAHGIGGTGLGLYLCRELIERHGGRIWFQSVEGEGSTFFFTLPLLSPASSDAIL